MDIETIRRACASTERVVEGVAASDLRRPTPCDEWDVQTLLNHLLSTFVLGAALLGGSEPGVAVAPGEVPDDDLVGDDPLKAYRVGVESLLAAASDDALATLHHTPLGEMPGTVLAGFTTLDILVHGWDLAKATGQDVTFDEDVAARVLAFAQQTLSDEMRAPRIGPELAVGQDAPVIDQLVAFLGRQP